MHDNPLIIEDVLMLMLDDKSGVPAGAGTLHYTLGGALLVELALLGRVTTDDSRGGLGQALNGVEVVAVEGDPLLQAAYDKVAKGPRRVQPLLLDIGGGQYDPVTDRLVERGFIRRERKKFLGLFGMNTLPSTDSAHEDTLRSRVAAVLEDGVDPDAHIAAVTGLISASGTLPSLHPRPKWSGTVYHRGKELEQGSWGAEAVNTAVARTAAAIAASSTAVVVSTVTAVT